MTAKPDDTADSGHVGPIIFANETARAQLVTHGEVVTFRKSQRTTGETWWRESRTGPKEGDVYVEELGQAYPVGPDLRPYYEVSGFESVAEWQEAIKEVNGTMPDSGYLYRATLRGESA